MRDNVQIRPMEEDDIASVSALYRDMYYEQAELGMVMQFRGEDVETMLASQIKSKFYICLVAEANSTINGFGIGSISRFNNKFTYGGQPFFGFIHDVYISRPMRQSGVGKQLADALEDAFRLQGIELIELHVLEGNEPGRTFWQRNGYNDVIRIMYKKL